MENPLEKFIHTTGALAEVGVLYFKACIRNGVSEEVAVKLANGYIQGLLNCAMNHEKSEDEDGTS